MGFWNFDYLLKFVIQSCEILDRNKNAVHFHLNYNNHIFLNTLLPSQSWILLTILSNWRRQWHPTPVLLPGKSQGRRGLEGCSPWGREESDDWVTSLSLSCTGEGNGTPLQCSCLENPRDGGAWWAAVYGVAQSRTRLKWLSSSSSPPGSGCFSFLSPTVLKLILCIVIKSPRLFHVSSTSPTWSSIWFLFLSQLYVFPFLYTNHSSTLPCSTLHMIHSDVLLFFRQQFLLGRVHV